MMEEPANVRVVPAIGMERHLHAALAMLQRGVRPTVDALVAECGGSRTTAQKALEELWTQRLPLLLAQRQTESDLPASVIEGMMGIWREATTAAEAKATAAYAEAMRQAEAERAEMRATLAAIEAERARHTEAMQQAQTRISEQEALIAQQREALEALDARLKEQVTLWERAIAARDEANRQLADARIALTKQEQAAQEAARAHAEAIATLKAEAQAEREAQRKAHAEAMDALKAAYLDAETRLRVDLDAARTEAAKAAKALDAARREHQQTIEALRQEIAALRKQAVLRPRQRRHPISKRKPL